jgi:pimeloyl-ACP methyl ester carboxylesterase
VKLRCGPPALCALLSSCAAAPEPAEIGTRPTVVFESGLGDGAGVWNDVIGRLAGIRRYAHARSGYDGRAAGPEIADGVRTSEEAVESLAADLEAADINGDVILVGHSLGGLYALKFAELHPDRVAGIVLVDGRPAEFAKECARRGLEICAAPRPPQPDWPDHIKAESAGVGASDLSSPAAESLRVPVTVISANRAYPIDGGAEAIQAWVDMQKDFARRAPMGRFVLADGSGHYVQREQPQLVMDEIQRMAEFLTSPGGHVWN